MGEIVYQYDDLDRTNISTSALILSCICCEDSFSYLIHAEGDAQHFRAKTILFDQRYPSFSKPLGYLSEVLRDDHMLFDEFQSKTIAIRGIPFTTIEKDQLVNSDIESILGNSTDIGPNDTIYSDIIGGADRTLLFALTNLLSSEIHMYYKNARIQHCMSSLACYALSAADEGQCRIHANISHRWLEIVIVENRTLKYINHMRWYDHNDVIYYIAALLENLDLDDRPFFEFSGSAYQTEMHDGLVDHLSIEDYQIVRGSHGDAKVLDLLAIGSCE